MPDPPQRASRAQYRPGVAPTAILVAIGLVVFSIVWMASSLHYRSCIAKAQAKYPAVPVSAFTGKDIGPVKVSFVKERTKAVDNCHRF